VSQLKDSAIRKRLHDFISDPSKRKWSQRAEHDIARIPGLTKEGLVVALCNFIRSGSEIEETVNTQPGTGLPETVYIMKVDMQVRLLYIKCKFTELAGEECVFIYSTHPTR
jgi:hypothetical protein